jgi:hypothetical protein
MTRFSKKTAQFSFPSPPIFGFLACWRSSACALALVLGSTLAEHPRVVGCRQGCPCFHEQSTRGGAPHLTPFVCLLMLSRVEHTRRGRRLRGGLAVLRRLLRPGRQWLIMRRGQWECGIEWKEGKRSWAPFPRICFDFDFPFSRRFRLPFCTVYGRARTNWLFYRDFVRFWDFFSKFEIWIWTKIWLIFSIFMKLVKIGEQRFLGS